MMHSPFFLSDAVVRALGWTLVHTLWQGAAIALALWFVLPRLGSARRRYWAAYGALMSLALIAVGTFAWVYEPARISAHETIAVDISGFSAGLLPVSPDLPELIAEKLEGYHPVIVAVWLSGFLFFLLRLAAGLHYVHRLRRRQTRPAPTDK